MVRLAKDNPRTCEHCGAVYHKKHGSWPMFDKRKFCGEACRSAAHTASHAPGVAQREEWSAADPDESKECEQCKQTFRRPKTVARSHFRARRFCGKECLRLGRKQGMVSQRVRWADR